MNKLAIIAAAVLVIVLLALPRVVGGVTEARVVERVAAIDANPQAAAELTAFDRGWFRSTARIELTTDERERFPSAPGDFVCRVDIGKARQRPAGREIAICRIDHQLHGR